MGFIDIVFAVLLSYAIYKGMKNGLFIEIASLLSLLVGIYIAIQFSGFMKEILQNYISWDKKYIEIFAFAATFILTVVVIHKTAKLLSKVADFAYLGWLNKLAGAFFSSLKTILALSVVIFIFEKINVNNTLVAQEDLDQSIFYTPTKQTAEFIYPKIEGWYKNTINNKSTSKPK